MTIYEKLSLIQSELRAPKEQSNDFGKYTYRSAEQIYAAAKPICKKHNAVLLLTDTLEYIGNRYYVKATATLISTDSDDYIESTAYAREEETKKGMDGSQITGTSSSYARKYAMNGLFNIDDQKDADTNEYTEIQNRAKEKEAAVADKKKMADDKPISADQAKMIEDLVKQIKAETPVPERLKALLKPYGCELKDLKESQYLHLKAKIEKALAKQEAQK